MRNITKSPNFWMASAAAVLYAGLVIGITIEQSWTFWLSFVIFFGFMFKSKAKAIAATIEESAPARQEAYRLLEALAMKPEIMEAVRKGTPFKRLVRQHLHVMNLRFRYKLNVKNGEPLVHMAEKLPHTRFWWGLGSQRATGKVRELMLAASR